MVVGFRFCEKKSTQCLLYLVRRCQKIVPLPLVCTIKNQGPATDALVQFNAFRLHQRDPQMKALCKLLIAKEVSYRFRLL